MRFLFILFVPLCLFADVIFSDIPPARIEIININPESCSKSCLRDLSKGKKVMAFIARFDKTIKDDELHEIMESYSNSFGLHYKMRFEPLGRVVEVALLMPRKMIGKYSTTTTDTILAYLLSRDLDFRFKIFDSINEDPASINRAINAIKSEKFNFAIAVVSKKESLETLKDLEIPVYVPTIPKDSTLQYGKNIVFGGISYEEQIKTLLDEKDSSSKIISYNDDSYLGRTIGGMVKNLGNNVVLEDSITNKVASNFSSNIARSKRHFSNGVVFLNTPVVKSGLILSQINAQDTLPQKILSTQINYNPAILNLIVGNRFKSILVASSIGQTDNKLIEYGRLLNSDMKYDWVNYSTALGMDLFINNMKNIGRSFNEKVEDNAVIYETILYEISNGKFVRF